jgi:uncharacterized Zn finger protein
MPIRPCPVCEHDTTRSLDEISKDARVWYYRCMHCGNVWTVPKDDPDAPSRIISGTKRPA